ncbi:MAG: helix-turn-helix transcriptional regulator, partial [Acidimicrobiia bacterium]
NAAQAAVAGIAESSVRALAKVTQVMPPGLRRRVEALRTVTVPAAWAGGGPTVDPMALITIAQACRDSERLEFGYRARDGERTARHVDPHRLVILGRRWYLVAYDQTRHDWRSFRLDRLDQPRRTGARFRPREIPGGDAAAFVRAGIGSMPAPHIVEALVEAPAAVVVDRVGRWATVEAVDDGRCILKMTTDSLDWPAMALGAVGADFTVLSSPELLEHLRDWSRRFGRAASSAEAGMVRG